MYAWQSLFIIPEPGRLRQENYNFKATLRIHIETITKKQKRKGGRGREGEQSEGRKKRGREAGREKTFPVVIRSFLLWFLYYI